MGTLTTQQIARWKHDGFLSPFPLLNATELKECREGLPMLAIDIYQYFQSLRERVNERPKVTAVSAVNAKLPGSDAAQGKPEKKKLH